MTRAIVYSTALIACVAATAMTISSIFLPTWVTWTVTATSGTEFRKTIGLHRTCSSTTSPPCSHFPTAQDCSGEDRYFCAMWKSVGFLMSFTSILEMATIVAFAVVLIGGRQKRVQGWKVVAGMLGLVGMLQCVGMAIVAYLFDYDERFFAGWKLDSAFVLCTVSWIISIVAAVLIALSAYVLPSEGDYELIPDRHTGF